jgi:hypothetical protein
VDEKLDVIVLVETDEIHQAIPVPPDFHWVNRTWWARILGQIVAD